jgi:hypothetical protein
MGEDIKSYKVQITIAIIGTVGVLGAAFLSNLDKFKYYNNPARPPAIMGDPQGYQKLVKTQNAEPFQITIYYFPTRKESAYALTNLLTRQGYWVNLQPASTYALLEKERNTPSYFFFNKGEFNKAMEVRGIIEKNLGHMVNAFKSDKIMTTLSMRLVITEAESKVQ